MGCGSSKLDSQEAKRSARRAANANKHKPAEIDTTVDENDRDNFHALDKAKQVQNKHLEAEAKRQEQGYYDVK